VLTAISGEDELHNVVFAIVRKINVNVGKFVESHPFLVEETAEVKAETDRADIRNFEAIANQ
jgi:hypothetical protein